MHFVIYAIAAIIVCSLTFVRSCGSTCSMTLVDSDGVPTLRCQGEVQLVEVHTVVFNYVMIFSGL